MAQAARKRTTLLAVPDDGRPQRRGRGVANDPNAPSERTQSARALMLACKAATCNWDVLGLKTFLTRNKRTGYPMWIQRIRCERCGSERIGRYPPGRTRKADRIGGYVYYRPPGWSDIDVYWGEALQTLVDEGLLEPPTDYPEDEQ